MSATDTDHTGTADTQLLRAVRDTIPSVPPDETEERISRVSIERDQGERTPEERQELDDRRWRILAEQAAASTADRAERAKDNELRARWERAIEKKMALQNSALTILLARDSPIRSEELANQVVLVVEDDVHLLPLMRTMLAGAGATVYYERNAVNARLRLERIGPDNLACAVIDVRLPDGEGAGLAHDVRHRSPSCGVVLTSGGVLEEYEAAAERHRFALLDKPFDPRALVDSVLAAMQLQSQRHA